MTQDQQTAEQKPEAAQQRPSEPMSISQAKKNVCGKLMQLFTGELMNERLMKMAGGDASRVAKCLTAFLSVITDDDGGTKTNKRYYYQCSMQSLVTCFLESMNMQLPFDSRKLISMVIYDSDAGFVAELDISYKGFINALNKHYDNAYVDAKLVFKDDEFECEETPGAVSFRHKAKDSFREIDKDFTGIAGGYCYFSYTTKNGAPIARIVRMSRADILKIKSKARTKAIWDEFPSEFGIKAIIRRGTKIPFAAIDLDIDIEEVANKHFALDKPESTNKLALLMQAQQEVADGENPKEADNPTLEATISMGDDSKPSAGPDSLAESEGQAQDGESTAGHDTAASTPAHNAGSAEMDKEKQNAKDHKVSDAQFEEVKPAGAWDGKTIWLGDRATSSIEFDSAMDAIAYMRKVMARRNHKSSRKKIIEGNSAIIAAAIKSGNGGVVAELHKLADEGAD